MDDGGDEEETNMRNGGDRGMFKYMLIVSYFHLEQTVILQIYIHTYTL